MNYELEYERLRAKGFSEKDASRAAKIAVAFDEAERREVLRFRVLPDQEMYDDSYIDTWEDMTKEERTQAKLELWQKIERDGVWGIVVEKYFKCDACGRQGWEQVDSCWGFVGDDWQDSGYDTDLKNQGLKAIGIYIDWPEEEKTDG